MMDFKAEHSRNGGRGRESGCGEVEGEQRNEMVFGMIKWGNIVNLKQIE
jgi:hypothetical protein